SRADVFAQPCCKAARERVCARGAAGCLARKRRSRGGAVSDAPGRLRDAFAPLAAGVHRYNGEIAGPGAIVTRCPLWKALRAVPIRGRAWQSVLCELRDSESASL